MNHPFAKKTELTTKQSNTVCGGNTDTGGAIIEGASPSKPAKKLRPDWGSTMAIGEEGGFRYPIF